MHRYRHRSCHAKYLSILDFQVDLKSNRSMENKLKLIEANTKLYLDVETRKVSAEFRWKSLAFELLKCLLLVSLWSPDKLK